MRAAITGSPALEVDAMPLDHPGGKREKTTTTTTTTTTATTTTTRRNKINEIEKPLLFSHKAL